MSVLRRTRLPRSALRPIALESTAWRPRRATLNRSSIGRRRIVADGTEVAGARRWVGSGELSNARTPIESHQLRRRVPQELVSFCSGALSPDRVGHLPQLEAPERFVAVLERFLDETDPAQFDAKQWRAPFHPTPDEPWQRGCAESLTLALAGVNRPAVPR